MIRKIACSLAVIAALMGAQPARAHRCVSYRPHRVYRRPAPTVYVQPYCCTLPCCYYPAPTYVEYVDYRDPEVAIMQDGINLFFNAISCSRR